MLHRMRKSNSKSRGEHQQQNLLSSYPSSSQLKTERQLSKLEEMNNRKVDMVKSLFSNIESQQTLSRKIYVEEQALQSCEANQKMAEERRRVIKENARKYE